MIRIAFYPEINLHNTNNNIYTKKIQSILTEFAEVYAAENLVKNPFNLFHTDYLYLNWFENFFFNSKNVEISKVECWLKLLFLDICRLFNVKILIVFHNKLPHSISIGSDMYNKVYKKFFKNYLKKAYKVLVLTNYSKSFLIKEYDCDEKKIYYVPHGNYIGQYKYNSSKKINDKHNIVVGYVGRINRYKKISEIINVFQRNKFSNVDLLIEGGITDLEYKNELISMSNENIKLKFNEISDDELIDKLKQLDVLFLPYNPNEALNSGLIYLAMSYEVAVATTSIGTVIDMPKNIYFEIPCNDYLDSEELNSAIERCLIQIMDNKDKLDDIKNNALEYVKTNHSWDRTKEAIYKLFEIK